MNALTIIPDKRLTLDQLDQWEVPADTTKEQWTEGHTQLLWYAHAVKRLLPKSEAFGRAQFGDEHWIETEARFQLDFGLILPDPSTPRETDEDRVLAYLCKGVERWMERSCNLDTWDTDRLNRALELLEPMEREAQRIRSLLRGA